MGWDDTIVALATPQGIGAIGVIRLSGNKAIGTINEMFKSRDLTQQPGHTLHVGLLHDGTDVLDQVVVSLYRAPASYTGEDVVEVSTHGSPFIQEKIINAITTRGVRLAKAGEFTQRAFLNGKLDLTQAEAVADLIASNTDASQRTALNNVRGGFSVVLRDLRDKLLSFSALIELELDFSQEDVEFADRSQLYDLITYAQGLTTQLISSFHLGNVIKNGVQVAIIGHPNAGKSTLLNTLLNENRAIVSHIPGTTRDTIEEVLNIDGILFRLIDTAGIRAHTEDQIESVGIERSLEKMKKADLVIYLFDVNEIEAADLLRFLAESEANGKRVLLAGNKVDLVEHDEIALKFSGINVLFLSAQKHIGIDVLKQRLVDLVIGGEVNTENTIVSNARHFEALRLMNTSLAEIEKGLQDQVSGDLLSLDIRRCLYYLGEITGEVTNEDQLDYIFSKFCIGK
ncbi:tRNA uridine-5-carboxymethylaminomethyl(34) synthesis GTPase MnmE [Segetibacter sp. 3557_3]|nr:tRNA uridine-5-carboxymethylaminomethyl(34) synthesis GTPase MnmE [Segetibacter sp. 3557_3]